ncbi:MAG: hypothetical protein IJ949_04845 [Oscillospiraceae bacterium]|nr:hypothetical protein [Oscillospiraceae bacterium]
MKKTIIMGAVLALCISFASASVIPALPQIIPFGAVRFVSPVLSCSGQTMSLVHRAKEEQTKKEEEYIPRGNVAYVVRANQRLNMETGKYYGELTLINETGLFDVVTVEDVENYNFMPVFTTERIGRVSEWEGKFIQFDMKKTDKIQKLEPRWSTVKNAFDGEDGFYRVNVVSERNGILSFYDTANDVDVSSEPAKSLAYREKGHAVIAISGGDYAGEALSKVSTKAGVLPAGEGNAVIQVYEGEIARIFSFAE